MLTTDMPLVQILHLLSPSFLKYLSMAHGRYSEMAWAHTLPIHKEGLSLSEHALNFPSDHRAQWFWAGNTHLLCHHTDTGLLCWQQPGALMFLGVVEKCLSFLSFQNHSLHPLELHCSGGARGSQLCPGLLLVGWEQPLLLVPTPSSLWRDQAAWDQWPPLMETCLHFTHSSASIQITVDSTPQLPPHLSRVGLQRFPALSVLTSCKTYSPNLCKPLLKDHTHTHTHIWRYSDCYIWETKLFFGHVIHRLRPQIPHSQSRRMFLFHLWMDLMVPSTCNPAWLYWALALGRVAEKFS